MTTATQKRLPQRTTPVDIDALHLYLWERTDSRGRILLEQAELAERLGLTVWSMNRLFQQMVADGRLRALSKIRRARRYAITDPALWRVQQNPL